MKCKNCDNQLIQGNFIVFGGGALLMDRKTDCGGPDDNMDAFLHLTCHDDENNIYENHAFEDYLKGGQFEYYFCCKQCVVSGFLNN